MSKSVVNIVMAGLGGQGVLKASDILAQAAFLAGFDVKKAEVHGMSQRGGSVTCDVRYGARVLSPMVPPGGADILVVLEPTQVDPSRHRLREGGTLLTCETIDPKSLPTPKALNVAMLGLLSVHLEMPEDVWFQALRVCMPAKLVEPNEKAFAIGRSATR